ncbi:MAG TPA: hypothetical protein VHI51_07735 [Ktedonobacterales bacterium]|nr:hypothetical protein [Ktedonobacterales bacterium]
MDDVGATTVGALLGALRRGGAAAATARKRLAFAGDALEGGGRAQLRAAVAGELAASLGPADEGVARWLLRQEIAAQQARGSGASEALLTLVAAVARYGRPDDALLIWRAREATPETRAAVDVEQMARADLTSTRATLARLAASADAQEAEAARRALDWLEEGAAVGALGDLPGYFLWADERFGLAVSGPT